MKIKAGVLALAVLLVPVLPGQAESATAAEKAMSKEALKPLEGAQELKKKDIELESGLANPAAVDLNAVVQQRRPIIDSFDSWVTLASVQGVLKESKEVGAPFIIGSSRIVGGERFEHLPEIVAIVFNGKMHCSGSVIAPHAVLTAAHCVSGYSPKEMQIAVGPTSYDSTERIPVSSGIFPPTFNRTGHLEDDIALLFLSRPYSAARKITLPKSNNDALLSHGELAFIGYGYALNEDGVKFQLGVKSRVDMPVNGVTPTTFFYGIPGKNTCNGDSGGPALALEKDGGYVLVGITSYGDKYCTKYGVDTRVDAYLDWIAANIKS